MSDSLPFTDYWWLAVPCVLFVLATMQPDKQWMSAKYRSGRVEPRTADPHHSPSTRKWTSRDLVKVGFAVVVLLALMIGPFWIMGGWKLCLGVVALGGSMWFCMTSAETAVEVGYRDGYAVARKQYEADTRDLPPRSDTRFHEAYTAGFRAGYRQRQSENGPSTSWQRFWKEMPQL